ncbi:PREDICTED: solute carrier family 35 member F1-like, partial [Phaethon lepturus]|uniref:solute carrier family 35 member F1-like n=1 Tax=Phaethon lepturus TaxID=97097 RepID=UPI0005307944
ETHSRDVSSRRRGLDTSLRPVTAFRLSSTTQRGFDLAHRAGRPAAWSYAARLQRAWQFFALAHRAAPQAPVLAQGKRQQHVASSGRAREPLAAVARGCHTSDLSLGYSGFPARERKQKGALDKVRYHQDPPARKTDSGEENLLAILKRRWWKYMILGIIDIEANYLVVKAYQYTTLTSVQLLDCFVIPVVILLSWFFLLVRYKAVHFIGIVVCILGMGCMAGADVLVGRQQGAGENKLIGDLLVLGGATLYGISNVCEEYIVRNLSRVEFLGMIGLFGSFFSGIQLAIMEHKELLKVPWDWQIGLLYVGFSACMFGLYSFMPVVIKKTSATAVNLSLLTADLYSLFCGLFLFHYK